MVIKRPLHSLYIHIPFCKDKCYYCNFVSFTNKNSRMVYYINSLINEIRKELTCHKNVTLESIYIGGGTPSLIDITCYKRIFDEIKSLAVINENAEVTMEINPGTITLEYLEGLRLLGVNRLSIGVQSFNDHVLKLINRKHSSDEAIEAIEIAKNAGFSNINIDLIYGLPDQDMDTWRETLNLAVSLNVQHISAYGLKIEEGTRFAKNLPPNLPEEELSAQMYLKTIEILTRYGFEHYEISNFAKSGMQSRHNLTYWHNEEYFGFGLAAHGYVDGIRYSNSSNLDEYITYPLQKATTHQLSDKEIIEEGLFLGLRLTEGINIEQFEYEYGINLLESFGRVINKYISSGHMQLINNNLKLTTDGILVSNSILADFLS